MTLGSAHSTDTMVKLFFQEYCKTLKASKRSIQENLMSRSRISHSKKSVMVRVGTSTTIESTQLVQMSKPHQVSLSFALQENQTPYKGRHSQLITVSIFFCCCKSFNFQVTLRISLYHFRIPPLHHFSPSHQIEFICQTSSDVLHQVSNHTQINLKLIICRVLNISCLRFT